MNSEPAAARENNQGWIMAEVMSNAIASTGPEVTHDSHVPAGTSVEPNLHSRPDR
jgi:hypothetical protein